MSDATLPRSAGVDAVIARLREEGIARGQAEAERIIRDAETRAAWIIDQAQAEAGQLRAAVAADAGRQAAAGRADLELAARDAVLRLKSSLAGLFNEELHRQVRQELAAPDVLARLIVELAGSLRPAVAGAGVVELLLPARAMPLEELRADPAELASGELTRLTRRLVSDMLRPGVTLGLDDDLDAGFRLRLDGDVVLEFTDEAVAALLREHLQPRFRAMLEGLVQ